MTTQDAIVPPIPRRAGRRITFLLAVAVASLLGMSAAFADGRAKERDAEFNAMVGWLLTRDCGQVPATPRAAALVLDFCSLAEDLK